MEYLMSSKPALIYCAPSQFKCITVTVCPCHFRKFLKSLFHIFVYTHKHSIYMWITDSCRFKEKMEINIVLYKWNFFLCWMQLARIILKMPTDNDTHRNCSLLLSLTWQWFVYISIIIFHGIKVSCLQIWLYC